MRIGITVIMALGDQDLPCGGRCSVRVLGEGGNHVAAGEVDHDHFDPGGVPGREPGAEPGQDISGAAAKLRARGIRHACRLPQFERVPRGVRLRDLGGQFGRCHRPRW